MRGKEFIKKNTDKGNDIGNAIYKLPDLAHQIASKELVELQENLVNISGSVDLLITKVEKYLRLKIIDQFGLREKYKDILYFLWEIKYPSAEAGVLEFTAFSEETPNWPEKYPIKGLRLLKKIHGLAGISQINIEKVLNHFMELARGFLDRKDENEPKGRRTLHINDVKAAMYQYRKVLYIADCFEMYNLNGILVTASERIRRLELDWNMYFTFNFDSLKFLQE